jgi:hypothetical protein
LKLFPHKTSELFRGLRKLKNVPVGYPSRILGR